MSQKLIYSSFKFTRKIKIAMHFFSCKAHTGIRGLNFKSSGVGPVAVAAERMPEANGTHMNNLSIGPQPNK